MCILENLFLERNNASLAEGREQQNAVQIKQSTGEEFVLAWVLEVSEPAVLSTFRTGLNASRKTIAWTISS